MTKANRVTHESVISRANLDTEPLKGYLEKQVKLTEDGLASRNIAKTLASVVVYGSRFDEGHPIHRFCCQCVGLIHEHCHRHQINLDRGWLLAQVSVNLVSMGNSDGYSGQNQVLISINIIKEITEKFTIEISDITNRDGFSFLHLAAKSEFCGPEFLRGLLELGMDPNVANETYGTAMDGLDSLEPSSKDKAIALIEAGATIRAGTFKKSIDAKVGTGDVEFETVLDYYKHLRNDRLFMSFGKSADAKANIEALIYILENRDNIYAAAQALKGNSDVSDSRSRMRTSL